MSKNPDLAEVRKQIDAVDRAVLDLIAQRLALSADVRRAKSGAKLWRPAREDEHVAELIESARASGTPGALVSRIWAELMSASISVQGSTTLHVALEGDARANLSLIRDRFGGSLPVQSYPTSSAALSGCGSDPEGIAVLPAPGGMQNWWTALAAGGALSQLKIVAALPRVNAREWPQAVAVAEMELDPQRGGRLLVAGADVQGVVRAEAGDLQLVEVALTDTVEDAVAQGDVIGYLPPAIL